MAARKTQHFRLGLFVIVVFVVFTYSLYRISDREGLFGDTITLYAEFRDLNGLRTGNNVRFAGVKVGSVTGIQIVNDTCLRVEMLLDSEASRYLRQNAQVAIGSDGLVGNMLVNIGPGKESTAPLVEDGVFLRAAPKVETADMLATLSNTNLVVAEITTQLLAITEKINQGEGAIGRLLNDKNTADDLAASLKSLRALTASLQASAQDVQQLTQAAQAGEGNLGYLLQDTSLRLRVDRWSEAVDSLLLARAEPLAQHLIQAAEAIEMASENAALLTYELGTSNTFDTVLRDSTVGDDIQFTLSNLRTATEKLDENMTALQSSWPFRRYFRKQARAKEKE